MLDEQRPLSLLTVQIQSNLVLSFFGLSAFYCSTHHLALLTAVQLLCPYMGGQWHAAGTAVEGWFNSHRSCTILLI